MKNSLSHQETPLLSIRHTYIRHTPVVSSILMCAASEGKKQKESQQPFVFPYVATPFLPYVQKIICVWLFVLRSSPRCAFVARRRSARLESSGGRWTRRPPGGRGATTARSTWLIASACSSCRGRGGSPIRSQRKKKKSPHVTLPLFLCINGILGESGKHTKRKKKSLTHVPIRGPHVTLPLFLYINGILGRRRENKHTQKSHVYLTLTSLYSPHLAHASHSSWISPDVFCVFCVSSSSGRSRRCALGWSGTGEGRDGVEGGGGGGGGGGGASITKGRVRCTRRTLLIDMPDPICFSQRSALQDRLSTEGRIDIQSESVCGY